MATMKRGLFFFGLGLLAVAFISGAAEIAASGLSGRAPLFMAWAQVWETLWPASLATIRAGVDGGAWALGWAIMEELMILPGWLLFGMPGFTLMLVFRDRSRGPDKDLVESLGLYDELARRARDEGYDNADEGDDMAPSTRDAVAAPDERFADENVDEANATAAPPEPSAQNTATDTNPDPAKN